MSNSDGQRLADALTSDDSALARAAIVEISSAPPSLSDPTARALAQIIKQGGERAAAASRVLGESSSPWFGGKGYTALQMAVLPSASALPGAAQHIMRGPDPRYHEKAIADKPPSGASWPARIWSVRRSIWVMAVLGLALLIGVPMMFGAPLIAGSLLLAAFALCVGIDGFRRKCPQCSMILGAERVALIANEYGHLYKWRCVGCSHQWEKQTYSASD